MKTGPESRIVRYRECGQDQPRPSISAKSLIYSPKAVALFLCLLGLINFVHGQNDQSNPRFTEGDINDSASLSFAVPLGSYKGRGLDLPVALNYSSSNLWTMEYIGKVHNSVWPALSQGVNEAQFSKFKTAGWKSSLSLPIIEFPKSVSRYDIQGKAYSDLVGGPGYRISEVYIHMPDGSTNTLRKSDQPIYGNVDMTGIFYAVDGSRMRFDANGTADTGIIYMPDGTRYLLGHPTSYIIDRHGNTLTYNESTRTWTDTLERQIANPLPESPAVGDVDYYLPGLAGVGTGQLKYTFKWKLLENALTPDGSGNPPSLRVVGSEALPYPHSPPSDSSNYPASQSAGLGRLFQSTPPHYGGGGLPTVSGLVVGKGYYSGQLFNPVVLTEIVLPDGTSYKYSYNVYGEIDKVVYPTNAYEKYEHTSNQQYAYECEPSMDCEEDQQPYLQTLRWIGKRQQSIDGTGGDLREWTFINTPLMDGGGTTKIIAPDKTRTEIYRYGPGPKTTIATGQFCQTFVQIYPFGTKDARVGMVATKKFYSASSDGLEGSLLRQEVFQYEQTTQNYTFSFLQCGSTQTRTYELRRSPRLTRQTNIIFEGSGDALAQSTTYQYDLTHESDTGIDQTQTAIFHFEAVDNQLAKDTDQPHELTQIPLGNQAKYAETTFNNDSVYRNANILGLPRVVTIKRDIAGPVISRSEMIYDECPIYCTVTGRGLPTSMLTWDSTKGTEPASPANQLVTRAKFDQWGNRIETTDPRGYVTTTVYDATYHAFAVELISPVPNLSPAHYPDGLAHGSNSALRTTTTYDTPAANQPPLGLVTETKDENDQVTRIYYNDPLLRRTLVIAPNGRQTVMQYGIGTDETTRWIKTRTQVDGLHWKDNFVWYDGIGRTIKTQSVDSSGDVFVLTEYDNMGRVKKTSNPYRNVANPTCSAGLECTESFYDNLGRITKVRTPDAAEIETIYALSTTGDNKGTIITVEDQANKLRRRIINALDNLTRVDEPDSSGALGSIENPNQPTFYAYDILGNLTQVQQDGSNTEQCGGASSCSQTRTFLYDSLSRLKQATNPESGTIQYAFDNNGNLKQRVDARGVQTSYFYDALNRITNRNYTSPANLPDYQATPNVAYFYDTLPNANGKVIKISNGTGIDRSTTEYTSFDILGNVTGQKQTTDGITYTTSYVYDLSGALVEETYPSGRVVRNTFDSEGDLSQVQSRKANSTFLNYANSFTYTAAGQISGVRLGNGLWEATIFNSRLQPVQIGLGASASSHNLLQINYDYGTANNNGNVKTQTVTVPTVGSVQGFVATQTFVYDSLNRIKQASETIPNQTGWQQTFQYDRYGNRRFDTANNATTTIDPNCAISVCNPQVATANNRLVGYGFDASGNMISDPTTRTLVFDSETKPVQINDSAGSVARYVYDGSDKRVKKIVGDEVTVFVYDIGERLIAEYVVGVPQTAPPKIQFTTADHLGSPRITTDQNGGVSSRQDFMPFGEEIPSTGSRTALQKYGLGDLDQKFTGKKRDTETGFDFFGGRYYSPISGRFISSDKPFVDQDENFPQSWNIYNYARNNPLRFVDENGFEITYATPELKAISDALRKNSSTYDAALKGYEGKDAPDLLIRVGNAGFDADGVTKADGKANVKSVPAKPEGQDWQPTKDANGNVIPNADTITILPAEPAKVTSAEIIIDSSVANDAERTEEVLSHEVGHVDDARKNTETYVENSTNNEQEGGRTPHDERPNEIVANRFERTVTAEKKASIEAAKQKRKEEEKKQKADEKRKREEEKRKNDQ